MPSRSQDDEFLNTGIVRKNIECIEFLNSLNDHSSNGVNCWDVSECGHGEILCWVEDKDDDEYFELYIGADGVDVQLNQYSCYLFYNIGYLRR